MSGESTETGRPDLSAGQKDVSLGGLPTEKPKGLLQVVKSTFGRLVQPGKPELTPQQQAREDLAREVLRAADIKARPEIEAAQARKDAKAVKDAQILADFEKSSVEQDKRTELEKQARLARTRARIEQLKTENDAAEGKTVK